MVSNKAESDIGWTVEICCCDCVGELQPITAIMIISHAFFMLCNLSTLIEWNKGVGNRISAATNIKIVFMRAIVQRIINDLTALKCALNLLPVIT